MPQTVTNNGNTYIWNADAYNADLQKAQLASYGFKVVIVWLSIIATNFIASLIICYYNNLQEYVEEPRIHAQAIQAPHEIRVTISPAITETPENIVGVAKAKNLKKWIGNSVIPDNII